VILYEMFYGRPPFEAATREAVLAKHLTELPTMLRRRSGVLGSVERIIPQALAKEPELRPWMHEILNGLWGEPNGSATGWKRPVAIGGGIALAASISVLVAWGLLAPRASVVTPLAQSVPPAHSRSVPAPPPSRAAAVVSGSVEPVATSAADAQPRRKTYRVGWLDSGRVIAPYRELVIQALVGYPRDVAFEYRSADGRADRLQELAAELVQLRVDIVFAVGNQAIQAARQATSTIPIVMVGSDAVAADAVARRGESSGNVTGVTYSSTELARSWLKLLNELRPTLSRVAVLYHAGPASRVELTNLQLAAAKTGA